MKYTHIGQSERSEISILNSRGYSIREIANVLGRSPNTISRELRKNAVKGRYDPKKAHIKARVRRKRSKYQGMKVISCPELRRYMEKKLKEGWSPSQISGRVRCVDTHLPYISPKGIYRYIYSSYGGPYEWCLRRKRTKRKGRYLKKKEWKTQRVFIDERPEIIDSRGRIGDWEGDFIESGKEGSHSLLVLYERKTRYVRIKKITKRDTQTVNDSISELLAGYPMKSLTLDNDISFQRYEELSQVLQSPVFFCHPYHSWEKGGVESVNGLIREYVLKGSDISRYTDEYLKDIEHRLNQRPRVCLKYLMPEEVMESARQDMYCDIFERSKTKKHLLSRCPT